MRVIFQDIDGVLNSEQFAPARERELQRQKAEGKERPDGRLLMFEHNIDPACMLRLNRIVAETQARLVISSTWRKVLDLAEIRRIFTMHGFIGEIIGVAPDAWKDVEMRERAAKRVGGYVDSEGRVRPFVGARMRWAQRGHEIAEWLRRNREVPRTVERPNFIKPVESFIILDDDTDMAHLVDRHIHTSVEHGLTDYDVDNAIKLMSTPFVEPRPGEPL